MGFYVGFVVGGVWTLLTSWWVRRSARERLVARLADAIAVALREEGITWTR